MRRLIEGGAYSRTALIRVNTVVRKAVYNAYLVHKAGVSQVGKECSSCLLKTIQELVNPVWAGFVAALYLKSTVRVIFTN